MSISGLVLSLATWSVLGFGLVLLLLQVLARELGYFAGRYFASRSAGSPEGIGVIVGSMLALLAFVLALTLSFASTRYSERQDGTLAEANAIGTAWLRAKAIGDVDSAEIAGLLEQYIQVRSDFVASSLDRPGLGEISERTALLQSQMWNRVAAIVRARPDPVATALMTSLNDVFDMSTAERFAFEKRLPLPLFWLLIGMALLCMAALGFQLGMRGAPLRMMAFLLTVMWTIVIIDILDLASARLGDFRTSTIAYEWTLSAFKTGGPIPLIPKTP